MGAKKLSGVERIDRKREELREAEIRHDSLRKGAGLRRTESAWANVQKSADRIAKLKLEIRDLKCEALEGAPYLEKLAGRYYDHRPSEFRGDALAYYDVADHPKAGVFYRLCYDLGHSSGYSSVDDLMADFVELLHP